MAETPTHTTVHVHQNASNGLGTAAGICSILGFFTCGLLCPIGLILGLCSMGKEPKGMAITGVILGAVGSLVSLIVAIFFGGTLFVACGSCAGLSQLAAEAAQQHAASEPAANTIIDYYEENGQLPDDATAASLIAPFNHEGHGFRYTSTVSQTSFLIEHPGSDGAWGTADDWQVNWDAEVVEDFPFDMPDETFNDTIEPGPATESTPEP